MQHYRTSSYSPVVLARRVVRSLLDGLRRQKLIMTNKVSLQRTKRKTYVLQVVEGSGQVAQFRNSFRVSSITRTQRLLPGK